MSSCRALRLTVACALAACSAAAAGERTEVIAITLDGAAGRPDLAQGVTVPNGTRDVRMQFAANGSGAASTRVRYRLEGFDPDWQDPPAQMRTVIHFLGAHGVEAGASASYVSGASAGWRGSLEGSEFTPREMEAIAPPLSERASVEFVSGGPETTLGVYAFRDFRAELAGQRFDFPAVLDWVRQGSNPAMATARELPGAPAGEALVLQDEDSRGYCGWRMAPQKSIAIRPGEKLRVQWRECFSIGAAGPAWANYRYLRPGRYRFQTLPATATGEPLGPAAQFSLTVRPPFWQEPWAWLAGAALSIGAVAFGVRRATQRRLRQRLAEVERQRALEGERARIAQDIHDDLGAALAQIAMLSELAQGHAPEGGEHRAQLDEIHTRARGAGRKLDEIVWAINPAHDSAEDLVGYLAHFAQEYLRLARIRFRLDVPATLPEISLTSGQRHQIFLAAKEAIHNAARHSAAGEITLKVRVEEGALALTVTDDGRGFVETEGATLRSHGSASMLARMRRIGGHFRRESSPGRGTAVTLKLPLEAKLP